jgi:hypothetical protein
MKLSREFLIEVNTSIHSLWLVERQIRVRAPDVVRPASLH